MKITNGSFIKMVRGDSESLTVEMQDVNGNIKPFMSGDSLTFTMRHSIKSEVDIKKTVTEFNEDGTATFLFYPEDTKELEENCYVYDIQLTFSTGAIVTIIPEGMFTLMPEVSYE